MKSIKEGFNHEMKIYTKASWMAGAWREFYLILNTKKRENSSCVQCSIHTHNICLFVERKNKMGKECRKHVENTLTLDKRERERNFLYKYFHFISIWKRVKNCSNNKWNIHTNTHKIVCFIVRFYLLFVWDWI